MHVVSGSSGVENFFRSTLRDQSFESIMVLLCLTCGVVVSLAELWWGKHARGYHSSFCLLDNVHNNCFRT